MNTRYLGYLGWKFVDANLRRRDVQYVVGQWTDLIPEPVPCQRGYHWCRDPRDLILEYNDYGPVVLEVEAIDAIDRGTKTVSSRLYVHRRTPWDDVRARLWAADCAEHVVHIYETQYPGDRRPRNAIEAARRLAVGANTGAAARDAAWAARDAARDAEVRWQSARLTAYLDGYLPTPPKNDR